MNTKLITLLCGIGLLVVSLQGYSQDKPYVVMFYNLENLFDTIPVPGGLDEDFTPAGTKQWNTYRYNKKLANMAEVIYGVAALTKTYPTILGVSEIENRSVLEDLAMQEKLLRANYQIVHYDSPDLRGIDVALLYRPDQFKYEGSKPLLVVDPERVNWKTRDVLMVWGRIEGELFYFFVAHWPSRLGGRQASEPKRCLAAAVVRAAVDSLYRVVPQAKLVIMGDLNDDPTDKSIIDVLGAKGKAKEVRAGDLFNPYYEMYKAGFGTLAYQDSWSNFDNMIVNETLLNAPQGSLRLYKGDKQKYYGNIFDRSFLRNASGQYKNYPFRTFSGDTFQNGYSDHFPVYIYLSK